MIKFKYTMLRSNDGTNYSEYASGSGNFNEVTSNSEILILEDTIPKTTTYKYKVYIWLDGTTTEQSNIQGASFDGELNAKIYNRYEITNIVKNGSFENGLTDWRNSGNVEIVNSAYHGDYSLKFGNSDNEDITYMTAQNIDTPIANHKYYGSLMFKSSSNFSVGDSRFEMFVSDSANGNYILATKKIQVSDWTRISKIVTVNDSNFLGNSYNWLIRNFIRRSNSESYADALIIVDLTEAFGEGNEPDKTWCDENIDYFDGTITIYK